MWSPDGSKIAFQSLRNGTNYQIYVMNADGSGQANVSNTGANDSQPSRSPDGSHIAFMSTRDSTTDSWTETDDDGNVINHSRLHFNKEIHVMYAGGSGQTVKPA